MTGEREKGIDASRIPACIYCQPQVAVFGLSEEQAQAQGHEVKVGRFPFRALGKALAAGHDEGLVKLVVDKEYGEILGCHIVGRGATDLIAEVGLARNAGSDHCRAERNRPCPSDLVRSDSGSRLGRRRARD